MKRGITLVVLVITIITMLILTGVITISALDIVTRATINTFGVEIVNIQNAVSEYYYRHEEYPTRGDYVLDITTIESDSLSQFDIETITDNKINLKIADLSLIGITDTEFGSGDGTDVYVLSEATGRVYYVQGARYEGTTYYTMVNSLYAVMDSNDVKYSETVPMKSTKVYDVIFTPSIASYTNEPITVQVKLPIEATINTIIVDREKSVGEEIVEGAYKVVAINETTEDRTGNYTIQVDYTYNGVTKTAKYAVTNYDNTAPELTAIVRVINDSRVIEVITTDAESQVRVIKYVESKIQDDTYFEQYGKVATGSEIVMSRTSGYTIYVEDNAGNSSKLSSIPVAEEWKANVITTVDDVPIPKGFSPSPYIANGDVTAENTKDGGFVIYQLTKDEIDLGTTYISKTEEQRTSLMGRNQYVWVPVDDFTKFKRQNFGRSAVINTEALGVTKEYWEVILQSTNMPYTTMEEQNSLYMSPTTLTEVVDMYNSVKKYGGFYIARYEAGLENVRSSKEETLLKGNDVYSRLGKYPYNYITWSTSRTMTVDVGGAVQVARSIFPSDTTYSTYNYYGVISTLVYSVQWDTMLQWLIDAGTLTLSNIATDSTKFGNYIHHNIISSEKLDETAKILKSGETQYLTRNEATYPIGGAKMLTTGALKAANIHNIYDIGGNMTEWCMEGYDTYMRLMRGGSWAGTGTSSPIADHNGEYQTGASNYYGFRPSLYIKNN